MADTSDAVLLARVTGSLLVVVLLALLVARFARRTTRGRAGGELQVCERVGLSRETAAVVLEAGGRRLLVGVSPTRVTLLADLTAAPLPGTLLGGEPLVRAPNAVESTVPAPRGALEQPGEPMARTSPVPLSRRVVRELDRTRRKALPPTQRGSGSVLDPRTWQQGVEALRDLTARRG